MFVLRSRPQLALSAAVVSVLATAAEFQLAGLVTVSALLVEFRAFHCVSDASRVLVLGKEHGVW
jgi:hypothetical protein